MHAMERSALVEAMSQLRRGLALLEALPQTTERDALELRTLTTLATAYSSTRGYAAPETLAAYARANELCERLGEAKELFWVIVGLWVSTYVSGDLHKSLELAHRLIRISENEGREMRMEALYCLGATNRFLGNLPLAKQHLENVLALDYPERIKHSRVYTALDIVTTSASIASEVRWLLGDTPGALELKAFALSESARLEHPLSMAVAETGACWLGAAMGAREDVVRHASNTSKLSEQYGLFLAPVAAIYLGWAKSDATMIAPSLQMFLMGGANLGTTQFYSLFAEAQWRSGDIEAALESLDAAERRVAKSGEAYWDAELQRLRGEILVGVGKVAEAEVCFRSAVERATARGAVPLKERAERSLRSIAHSQSRV
jgi:predicted ATPase